jgi:pre-mRNA-splicing factor SYF1
MCFAASRSVAASYAQMHIDSATQIATLTAPGAGAGADAAAGAGGGKRPREDGGAAGDSMEALEAAAEAAAAAAGGGTRVSGFVSAGIIQQGQDQEGGLKQPGQEQQPGGAGEFACRGFFCECSGSAEWAARAVLDTGYWFAAGEAS